MVWSKKWALVSSLWVGCQSHKCHCLIIGPKGYGRAVGVIVAQLVLQAAAFYQGVILIEMLS